MSNKTSGFKRAIGIVLGVITMLVLIALFVVLVMAPIPNIWVDKVTASDNAIDQTVSPTQSETYCPAPIGLADTGTYGDSAFQATVGNLSTQARYAAFGSVYSATVSAIGQKSSSDDVTLKDADSTDDSTDDTSATLIQPVNYVYIGTATISAQGAVTQGLNFLDEVEQRYKGLRVTNFSIADYDYVANNTQAVSTNLITGTLEIYMCVSDKEADA